MAKTKISEFSATPANNTDIDSINIAEGCAPSGINDAIRELMAQLKDFQTGAVGDSFNGPVGTSTAAAGAFTTLAASGSVTLSGGTANGVTYLNGSKVLTSGSALVFDGTNLGIGNSNPAGYAAKVMIAGSANTTNLLTIQDTGTSYGSSKLLQWFINSTGANAGAIVHSEAQGIGILSNADLPLYASGSEQMRLTSTGLGIGTSSPSAQLQLNKSGTGDYTTFRLSNSGASGKTYEIGVGGNTAASGYANSLYFYDSTAAALRMVLDTSGNVGIGTSSPYAKIQVAQSSSTLPANWIYRGTQSLDNNLPTTYGFPYLQIGRSEYRLSSLQTIGFGYVGANGNNPPAEIGYVSTSVSGETLGDLVFATRSVTTNTAATERMRLDSSGNLGLGVTPSAWNSVYKAMQFGPTGAIYSSSSNDSTFSNNTFWNASNSPRYLVTAAATYYYQYAGAHTWATAASGTAGNAISFTQAMNLDASGRLGIGQTSPSYVLDTYDTVGQARFSRNKTTTGDMGGLILAGLNASSSAISYALIQSNASTVTAGSEAGNLDFYTMRSGSITQAARIDSSGNLLVASTNSSMTTGTGIKLTAAGGGASTPTLGLVGNSSDNGQGSYHLYSSSLSQYQFYVTYGGTIYARSTSITGLSDVSEKENIRDLETGLNSVLALQPRRFDWKNGSGTNVSGFIAQEVQSVLPDLVESYKISDEENKLGLKMGDMIPTLVKAIQEQQAIIDSLKARLDAANL